MEDTTVVRGGYKFQEIKKEITEDERLKERLNWVSFIFLQRNLRISACIYYVAFRSIIH